MDVESYEHGVPSWVDLGTPDPKKAARFYSSLFGWDVQEGPPESGGYAIAHLRGKAVAGLGPQQNPGPPVWMTYVNVDSADDTVAKVKAKRRGPGQLHRVEAQRPLDQRGHAEAATDAG